MGSARIKICDICKAEFRDDIEGQREGYRNCLDVLVKLSSYNRFIKNNSFYRTLCADCSMKLGFEKKMMSDNPVPDLGDQLYELVAEIAQDTIDNQ